MATLAKANLRLSRHHGSSPGTAMPRKGGTAKDGEGWQTARGKARPQLVPCSKPGCKGSCPIAVVRRGLQADGVPAKCLECDRRYQLPPGTASSPQPKPGATAADSKLQAKLKSLEARCAALEKEKASGFTSCEVEAGPADDSRSKEKVLREKIRWLETLPTAYHLTISEDGKGYAEVVQAAKAQLQQLQAEKRSALPLDQRKANSEAFLGRMQKQHDGLIRAVATLHEQQAELAKVTAQKEAELEAAATRVEQAKLEVAEITEQFAAQVRGEPVAHKAPCSEVTATAVKGFFQSLPTAVSAHPEGQQTIQQVMQLLELLDAAAKSAGGDGTAATSPGSGIASAGLLPTTGHRPPGTTDAVANMLADSEMECEVADFEELFRHREGEQPELRAQRLKAGLRSRQSGPNNKFRKDKH